MSQQQQQQPPQPSLTPLARATMEFLDRAWKDKPNDPWHYVKALATRFVVFIANVENTFAVINKRLEALEGGAPADVSGANGANGNGTLTPEQEAQRAAVRQQMGQNGNGSGGPPGPGWIRLGGDGNPLTPEETQRAEAEDMQLGGIQVDRYIRAQPQA